MTDLHIHSLSQFKLSAMSSANIIANSVVSNETDPMHQSDLCPYCLHASW